MVRSGWEILASLFLSICFAAASSAQSASPAAIVDDFAKAWNSHDTKAFDRLFTEDVIWVPVAEVRVEGRSDLVKELAEIHATWAKSTTVTQNATKVQTLGPDVAVVFFHSVLAGQLDEHGKPMPAADRAMVLVVVKRSDGWEDCGRPGHKAVSGVAVNARLNFQSAGQLSVVSLD
jgi:uncharacterized protein (TIGR02246 family)